jgi:hypothetical protein
MTLKELIDWIKRKKGATDIGVVDSCEIVKNPNAPVRPEHDNKEENYEKPME